MIMLFEVSAYYDNYKIFLFHLILVGGGEKKKRMD